MTFPIVSIVMPNWRQHIHTWKISKRKEQKVKIRNHPEVDMIIHCFKQYLQGLFFLYVGIIIHTYRYHTLLYLQRKSAHMRWREKNTISTTDNLIRPSYYVRIFCAYTWSGIDISHKTFASKGILLNAGLNIYVQYQKIKYFINIIHRNFQTLLFLNIKNVIFCLHILWTL